MIAHLPGGRRGLPGRADSDNVRRQNRSLVLSALRRRSPIARVELGAETHLSPATITAITADLIAEGLVVAHDDDAVDAEAGGDRTRRGRPRVLLELAAQAAHVLAVKFSYNQVVLQLADFSGKTLVRHEAALPTFGETRDSFPKKLAAAIRDLVTDCGLTLDQIAEIAIGAQGFVDTKAGSVMWSPAFGEADVRLVEPLIAELGRPCTLSNDANMIAQALHEADPDVYGDTFAVVFIDYGVGMGLFIGGELHHGAAGSAAEFGHMNHMPHGPLCRCGRRGCLEAFAADYAIYREAKGLSPDTMPTDAHPTQGELIALEAAAHAGDARIRAVYEQVGTALGYGLARLMALINPSRIIFTGKSTRAYPLFAPAMMAAIEDGLVEDLRRRTVIETRPWQDDMIMSGLISYMLSRLDRDVFSTPQQARAFRRPEVQADSPGR